MNFLWDFILHRYMGDWDILLLAFRAFFAGVDPYTVGSGQWRFFGPIWTLIAISPIAVLPDTLQPLALFVLPIIAVLLIGRRLEHRSWWSMALLLLSVPLWLNISWGNIDWLVWTGLLFPMPFGLLLLAMKPQATALAMVVLVLRERRPIYAVIPLAACVAWWLIGYGVHTPDAATNAGNMSWFPYSLILGLPLAAFAVWKRNLKVAMAATIFCTPYVSGNSFLALSLASPVAGTVYWIAAYAVALIRGLII